MFENIKSDSHWWIIEKIAEKIRIAWLWAFIYVTKGDVLQKKKEQLEIKTVSLKTAKKNGTSKDACSFVLKNGPLIQNSGTTDTKYCALKKLRRIKQGEKTFTYLCLKSRKNDSHWWKIRPLK